MTLVNLRRFTEKRMASMSKLKSQTAGSGSSSAQPDLSGTISEPQTGSARFESPLAWGVIVLAAALACAILSVNKFCCSKPDGNPFWPPAGSPLPAFLSALQPIADRLPPFFNPGHEPAYAAHDYLPIGPRDQFFHRRRIEEWSGEDSPINGLVRTEEDNPWIIRHVGTSSVSVLRLVVSADGRRVGAIGRDGQVYVYHVSEGIWELQFFIGAGVGNATALDPASRLIFGENRIQYAEGDRLRNRVSFFPSAVNAVTEIGKTGIRVAVGDAGAIYLGVPIVEGLLDQANAKDEAGIQPGSPVSIVVGKEVLGETAGLIWQQIEVPAQGQVGPDLQAVHFVDELGVAVGKGGAVMVTYDGGVTWRSGVIGGGPNLTDIRVNRERNYAVAIGRPTSADAPDHGVLYKTETLPLEGGGIGEWQAVPWQAGAPLVAYLAAILAVCAALAGAYFVRLSWLTDPEPADRPVAASESDRVIGWDDPDALGLKPLAMQVSMFLRNAQTEPPLVLGVAGGWGSGKSSLMNLLCEDLQRRGTSAVKFNAWHHQSEEHLLAALFEAVRTRAIPRMWTMRGLWFRARLIGPRLRNQMLAALPVLLLLVVAVIVGALLITEEQGQAIWKGSKEYWDSLKEEKGEWTLGNYSFLAVPGLGGLALFVWLRSLWVALPVKPASLLKNFASLWRITGFADRLSFRFKFGRAFGEVCTALRMPGVPGLVIFIDDLDRCQAESVLSIFEAVNYLVTVGDCIVVMGFDRAQVEHSIGAELKDIADGIPDREIPFNFGGEKDGKRRAYARHYMEKLINLEITIPQMTPQAAAELAEAGERQAQTSDEIDKQWLTRSRPLILRGLRAASLATRTAIILVAGGAFWHYGGDLYAKVVQPSGDEPPDPPQTQPGDTDGDSVPNESGAAGEADVGTGGEQVLAQPEPPPTPISAQWNYEEMWVLAPALALAVLLALWLFARRAYTISKNVEHDPDTFVDALKEANMVIEGVNGTPRAIKRFMNRMRFASARMRQIHYQVGFVDRVARGMGWVSKEFETRAESAPTIADKQVVALGATEVFLRRLPDPDTDHPEPRKLIDNYLGRIDQASQVNEIGEKIKKLLVAAKVGKAEMKTYSRTLHSSHGAPADDDDSGDRDSSSSTRPSPQRDHLREQSEAAE